jgi:hypothetical protein
MDKTAGDFLQRELKLLYMLQLQAINDFELGNIRASRGLFAEIFYTLNNLFATASLDQEVFFFPGSPLVRECMDSPRYSEKSILQNQEADDPKLDEMESSTRPDIPLYSRILKLPLQCTPNQFLFTSLYNLAISTHLAALHSMMMQGDADAKLIQDAAKLWDFAYAFQWRESLNLRPIHALSILVNLGHIQSLIGNEIGSKRCFEKVLSACQILEGRNQEVPSKQFFLYQALRMLGLTFNRVAPAA